MGKFSNSAQVVYAAAVWVFGGDNRLTGSEQLEIKDSINGPKTPWSLDDEDVKWVINLWRGDDLDLDDDIIYEIENEFDFSLEDKYKLFSCVCVSMNALRQGYSSRDGWSRANQLRDALGIKRDDYNRWVDL